jgi:hypothetical protein
MDGISYSKSSLLLDVTANGWTILKYGLVFPWQMIPGDAQPAGENELP